MNKVVIIAMYIAILVSGCYYGGPEIYGDGNVVKESREVFPFERIKLDGVGSLKTNGSIVSNSLFNID